MRLANLYVMTVDELAIELLGLPAKERARLAERLIASLEEEPATAEIESLWIREAERRLLEVKAGKGDLQDAETVLKEARARLKR